MNDSTPSLFATKVERVIRVEFDGGTPCNIPRLGYGNGYGSYRIDQGKVVRVEFGIPMSNNVAEISTLIRALEEVSRRYGREGVELDIYGDSQIALKWARGATESGRKAKGFKKSHHPDFINAVLDLRAALNGFSAVRATWQKRDISVEVFGR